METRDAGFARAIASETLRHFGQLDALIRHFVSKPPPPRRAGATPEILLAVSCELLFLNVAPHAAVDAANRLAQADPGAVHYKGLINATLRNVAREGKAVLDAQDEVKLATPSWLWKRWVANYGEKTVRSIAKAHLLRAPLDLTLKRADDPCTDFKPDARLTRTNLRLTQNGAVDALPGYKDGRWWVQDFAASLPARLFGDVAGKPVIDLCAAPGGKMAQLAAAGARVTALDLSAERLDIVRENLSRLKLPAMLVAADARVWRPESPAPFVLLDAPCTATGTIRRHPDLPWIKGAADIEISATLQRDLLDAAADMTAPGGTLVYAVCSLEPEESVEQIESFLERRNDFCRAPITGNEIFDAAFVSPQGDLRTFPHYWSEKGGMDGFFAARLRRNP